MKESVKLKMNNINIRKIFIHIGVWGVLMLLTTIEWKDFDLSLDINRLNLAMWITYILVYYINYFLLIPKLLFKKKYLIYVLLTFLLAISTSIGVRAYYHYQKVNEIKEYIEENNTVPDKYKDKNHHEYRFQKDFYDKYIRENNAPSYILNPFSNRNFWIIYAILFVLSTSIIDRFIEKTKKEEKKAETLQREKISSELKYLKQQINPHFLFNALNSIYSLTILNSENSSDAVLKLSSILRYMLYETDKEKVQFADEIEVIENYLGLQRLRLTDKTTINFTKEGCFDAYRIEPMLIIPILENAFKYGIDAINPTEINISLKIIDERLLFSCSNKIVKQNDDSKNSGIGIKNIERRLDLIYEKDYIFNTEIKENIFKVELVLPLKTT